MPEGRRPRGVTPCPRSGQWPRVPDCDGAGTAERSYPASEVGGAAERRYPASEVRGIGREELPHAPMPEARGGRRGSNPTSKEQQLHGQRRAERSYSMFKVRRGSCEEKPLVQSK